MDPCDSGMSGKNCDGALVITGNPIFNAPVFIRSNYYCEKPLALPPIEDTQAPHHSLDLLVLKTTEEKYSQHLAEERIYQMKSNPKGRALIINNEFKNVRGERKGSSQDLMKMMQLWEQMGCAVEMEKNLTGPEIKTRLVEFAESDRVSNIDFCVVFIMSHGAEDDLIIGEKHTRTSVEGLVQVMKDSKTLLGKPKLLFFQMCRGSEGEKQSQIDADCMDTSDSSWFLGMLQNLLPRGEQIEAESTEIDAVRSDDVGETYCDATAEEHLDSSCDMMIAFATQPDHVSFRAPTGSWFVSAIAKVFAENAKDMYLKELMNAVKDEVRTNTSYMPSNPKYDRCTATVEARDTFMGKKLYLFPGYPENF